MFFCKEHKVIFCVFYEYVYARTVCQTLFCKEIMSFKVHSCNELGKLRNRLLSWICVKISPIVCVRYLWKSISVICCDHLLCLQQKTKWILKHLNCRIENNISEKPYIQPISCSLNIMKEKNSMCLVFMKIHFSHL